MSRERLIDVDLAKGLGIFLVVLGHIVARDPPAGNEWYVLLKAIIYKFHMPFFMFISGLIAAYTYRPITSLRAYGVYVRKRADRLLSAYLLFSVLVFLSKLISQQFMHVDNAVDDPFKFYYVIWQPMNGFAAFLWFVWVLFLLYCIAPLLLRLSRERLLPLLLCAFALQFVPPKPYFAVAQVCEYLFVFLLGFAAIRNYPRYTSWLDRYGALALALFGAILAGLALGYFDLPKWVVGLASLPALHYFVRTPLVRRHPRALSLLALYTFPIYLMNTLAIGLVKAVILKFIPWDGPAFWAIAPALLLSGIFGPILLKKYAFRHHGWLDRITT